MPESRSRLRLRCRGRVPALLIIFFVLLVNRARADVVLPTPREHYETYDARAAAFMVVSRLMPELEPAEQAMLMRAAQSPQTLSSIRLPRERIEEILERVSWKQYREQILEILLHESNVLDFVPEVYSRWLPVVHDSLLFFLDRLDDERLISRLVAQVSLGQQARRGDRVFQFIAGTPTLQKIGQILARNPDFPEDIRDALKVLENSLQTTDYEELIRFIREQVGEETLQRYDIRFDDRILAEATVGAVVRCQVRMPGEGRSREAVAKVIKPQSARAMMDELEIFDELTVYFSENPQFYDIGSVPVSEIFADFRVALAKEIQVLREQDNLIKAARYYSGSDNVVVPRLFPFSTERVTFMDFIHGSKITDAFPDRPPDRARLARSLVDVLSYDVLFSPNKEAIFHGDPHAGNVFHVPDDASNRYRIALLDWGLYGRFSREQRAGLMQLFLGVVLQNRKRLVNHVGALIEGEEWKQPERRRRIETIVDDLLEREKEKEVPSEVFSLLAEYMAELAREGHATRFNIGLFVKSQVTIVGILVELDPELRQDQYLMERIASQVKKELPKRILFTVWFPAWNSHSYRSMLSNEDVKDMQMKSAGRFFKKAGRGIWQGISFPFRAMAGG